MTPDEKSGLLIFGSHEAKNVSVLIFITIVYGICLCVTPVALYTLLRVHRWFHCNSTDISRRREKTRQTVIQLIVVIFLFCVMSLYTASVGLLVIWQISQTLSHLEEGLTARLMYTDNSLLWNYILETWMQPIQFIAGDAVIIWRAWVFWQSSLLVHIVLVTFLLADTAIAIFSGVYATERILVSLDNPALGADLASATVFLSFGANLVATTLIAIKARQHRQLMREAFPNMSHASSNNRVTRNESVLFVLIESGALLCAAQMAYAILALVDTVNLSPLDWARSFMALFCQLLANMNPILVIIIVRLRMSVIDKTTLQLTTMSQAQSQVALSRGDVEQDQEKEEATWAREVTPLASPSERSSPPDNASA